MSDMCPECGMPIVNGFFCGCGLNERAVETFVSGSGKNPASSPKKAVESELKAKEKENEGTKKAIRELLKRKLELRATGLGWLKTYHAIAFGAYEPKAKVKEKQHVELAETPTQPLSAGEIASRAVVVLVLAVLVLPLLALAALIVSPIIALVLSLSAVWFAVIYCKMTFEFVKWASVNAARSSEERASLESEASKLDVEIEHLRVKLSADQIRIDQIKWRLKKVSEVSKAKGFVEDGSSSSPGTDSAFATVQLPGLEDVTEGNTRKENLISKEQNPQKPRVRFGLFKAAINSVKFGACPHCHLATYVEDAGKNLVKSQYEPIRRPGGGSQSYSRIRVKRERVYKATFYCKGCERHWDKEVIKADTVGGACPKCYDPTTPHLVGDDETGVRGYFQTVERGAINTDRNLRFAGVTAYQEEIRMREVTRRLAFRCMGCSYEWAEKSIQIFRI